MDDVCYINQDGGISRPSRWNLDGFGVFVDHLSKFVTLFALLSLVNSSHCHMDSCGFGEWNVG